MLLACGGDGAQIFGEERGRMPDCIELHNFIAGQWCEGAGAVLVDENPARHDDPLAHGSSATESDLDRAVAAAMGAGDAWSLMPMASRARVLLDAASTLDRHTEDYGSELTREEGKTLAEGIGEVRRAAQVLRYYAGAADREDGVTYASPRPYERILVARRPLGVIAAVTPFNFPIAIPAWKIAAALIYGNTVVWKPAATVPLLAMRLAQALIDAGLPDGALNLIHGDGPLGAALIDHRGIDGVTFTGSTAVGRRIAASCGARGVRVQAELGGKNAAIVLRDADLELAVEQVLIGAFRSAGQKCTATSRLVLDAHIADEFLDAFERRVMDLAVGDPLDANVDIGPVIDAESRARVVTEVDDAVSAGATVIAKVNERQPGTDERGHFVSPTVLEIHDQGAAVWDRELFGPVLAVRRASGTQQAFAMAGEGQYGLSGAVFTQNLDQMLHAIQDLKVGVLHINSETAGADPHVPFGGVKASGFGPKELGEAAREFFTETTTVYLGPGRTPMA